MDLDLFVVQDIEPRLRSFGNRVEREAPAVSGVDGMWSVGEACAQRQLAALHQPWARSPVQQFVVVPRPVGERLNEAQREQDVTETTVPEDHRPAELADH